MHSFQNLAGIWLECGIVHGVKRAIRSLYHDSRYWGPGAPIPGLILFCIGSVGPTGPRSPMHSFQNLAGIWLECGIVHGVKRAIRSLYHDSRYWGPGAPIPGLILFCIGSVGPTGPWSPMLSLRNPAKTCFGNIAGNTPSCFVFLRTGRMLGGTMIRAL